MLDGRVLGASQVEYKPFGKPPLKREALVCKVVEVQAWIRRHLHPLQIAVRFPDAAALSALLLRVPCSVGPPVLQSAA